MGISGGRGHGSLSILPGQQLMAYYRVLACRPGDPSGPSALEYCLCMEPRHRRRKIEALGQLLPGFFPPHESIWLRAGNATTVLRWRSVWKYVTFYCKMMCGMTLLNRRKILNTQIYFSMQELEWQQNIKKTHTNIIFGNRQQECNQVTHQYSPYL